jgi:DNA-binding transcriptional ArsR family regulator
MLRVHFTTDDLIGISVAAEPEPLWELAFSLEILRRPGTDVMFGEWRERTLEQLSSRSVPMRTLRSLDGIALRGLLFCSAARRAGTVPGLPATESVRACWQVNVAPYWHLVRALVRADAERRVRVILAGGMSGLLSTLHPNVQWRPPVLRVSSGAEQDLCLNGRGLRLLPSFFCWPGPTLVHRPDAVPVLVFPVDRTFDWLQRAKDVAHARRGVIMLLGTTRAAILSATAGPGRSTTELAEIVGVSPPTVSQHTSVLRNAGLITTRRDGVAVIHQVTDLGITLLMGTKVRPVSPEAAPELAGV